MLVAGGLSIRNISDFLLLDGGAEVKANKVHTSDLRRYRPPKVLTECECFHSNSRLAVRSKWNPIHCFRLWQVLGHLRLLYIHLQ